MNNTEARAYLQKKIVELALVHSEDDGETEIFVGNERFPWVFDFRRAFSYKSFLLAVSEIFWSQYDRKQSWQIGGLESASLPLITTLVLTGENTTGFYIRKSRKKKSQMRQIEGVVDDKPNIILVDDLMNTGSSFLKPIKILEAERGLSVHSVFSIVQFKETNYYDIFKEKGVGIHSIFTLSDLNARECKQQQKKLVEVPPLWQYTPATAHLREQGSKLVPLLVHDGVVGFDDDGHIRKHDVATGAHLWERHLVKKLDSKYSTVRHSIILNDTIYSQTYHGMLVATQVDGSLHQSTALGDAFRSPLYEHNGKLLCVVTEGVGRQSDRVLLYDPTTGLSRSLLQADGIARSLAHDEGRAVVYVAKRDHVVQCVSMDGTLVWEQTLPGTNDCGVTCLQDGNVLAIAADGEAYVLSKRDGSIISTHTLSEFHADVPTIAGTTLYGATLSREIYAYDLSTQSFHWKIGTTSRMYSRPTVRNGTVYIGDNSGVVHVLDCLTGTLRKRWILPERITNPIMVTNQHVVVSTFAGALYTYQNTVSGI